MRVLLVNQYFWPDRAATAQLLADLAEDLAASGAEVTALAGRAGYSLPEGVRLGARETWRGVRIRRVAGTRLGRSSLVRRLVDYLSFLVAAAARTLVLPRQDVVVCLSTPPLVAALGILWRLRGARFVYKVEDLYPDVAVALGVLRQRAPWTLALAWLSAWLLHRADLCVALDRGMARTLMERGARRVEIIPNWADGEAIGPDPEAGAGFRRRESLGSGLLVLYSGNLGRAHRFDAVLEAAGRLARAGEAIQFLFVGDGARREEVARAARDLANVRLLPFQPRERLRALYSAADVHLVCLRDSVSGLLVPSKYAAALAAGRPVLLVGGRDTDMAREIAERGAGWVCPHDPAEVIAGLRRAADDEERAGSGLRARRLFDERYTRRHATRTWAAHLGRLVGG